ncbi:MAG TPA: hypothetical protein EYP56_14315 [Planctomycetaceae bacterium]|nr:hypothetical protein [Planctomycetaceae bacterium]HIQ23321.1 hypothetical protein [Planctomycetota bacterium]
MKKTLRQLLLRSDFDRVAQLAENKGRVLRVLTALSYDPDPLVVWRAVEATGAAAERVARHKPERVREHLRHLHWLISEESGGICWHAPELMAEVVRRLPGLMADYLPIVLWLIKEMPEEDLAHFRPGILWAIGRLAPVAGETLDQVLPAVKGCLDHPDPQVRGMTVWCLGQAQCLAPLTNHAGLADDPGELVIYENGQLRTVTVGSLVRRAVGPSTA